MDICYIKPNANTKPVGGLNLPVGGSRWKTAAFAARKFWLRELFFSLRVRQILFWQKKSKTEYLPELLKLACWIFFVFFFKF